MRWFKHYTDNHKGKSIQFLFDSFGHFGVAGYYILLEMCAEKLEQKSDDCLTEVDLLFSFHQRIVRQNLRASLTNVRRLLDQCQTFGLLTFEITSDLIEIKMPILLNLLDSDQKKPRLNRVTSANGLRLEKNRVEKNREEVEKNIPDTSKKEKLLEKENNKKIKDAYFNAFRLRYGVEPVSNATFNSQVSSLRKKLGVDDSISVVEFYLKHNDSFYLKNTHSFGYCLSNAETLRTQMLRGKPITSQDVRNFEKTQNAIQLNESIKNGEDF